MRKGPDRAIAASRPDFRSNIHCDTRPIRSNINRRANRIGSGGRRPQIPLAQGGALRAATSSTLLALLTASIYPPNVEGSEPEVLRGARVFISTCNPVVACDVNVQNLRALGENSESIFGYFKILKNQLYIYNDDIQDFEEFDTQEKRGGWYDILCVPQV